MAKPLTRLPFTDPDEIAALQLKIFERSEVDPKSDCWLYPMNHDGYPSLTVAGKPWRLNRLSFLVFNGVLRPGDIVCHSCDVRRCVNPDHLWRGSYADNARDMIAKGRGGRQLLTMDQALIVRNSDQPSRELAKELGVSYFSVRDLRAGRSWQWLDNEDAA